MGTSRSYMIDLSPELAQQAEELARRDSRSVSDLLEEALRVYSTARLRQTLNEIGTYAASRNTVYTEADIPRLIDEVRAERTGRV